jgi:hypothetical protein
MLDDIDKGFCLFAMQISSNMAKTFVLWIPWEWLHITYWAFFNNRWCASYVTVAMLVTLTKDFACLQCKFHPTWRKSLYPLNPMGVVAHHLYGILTR